MNVSTLNVWDTLECYCKTNDTCVIYFTNEKIKTASAAQQTAVWTWYADFMEDSVLDMIKTLGEWDMIPVKNPDQAIAYASSWFPAKEDCPDDFHYWTCHVMGADGEFEWKNVDRPVVE